jgi:putative nucleotidyltransferase with HDIG domain
MTTMVELTQVVQRLRDLPALPSIVLDLISSFGREDVDVTTLAEKMSRDQAMAAKILRLANSSFYGLPARVKTVRQAIVVLGFDSARALAVAGNVIDRFGAAGRPRVDVAYFWRHSIATALCARSLARHAGLDQDAAFIGGLLHDIGRLVLATSFPEQYARVIAEYDGAGLSAVELRVLGVDHERAGQLLAEAWKFPPVIQRAIGQHHAPAAADLADIPGVVHVANGLVHALDPNGRMAGVAAANLGLLPEQLQAVCRETEGQFEEACRLLMQDER